MVAYDRLAAEGFVAGRVGAGTFVSYDIGVDPSSVTVPEICPLSQRAWRGWRPRVGLALDQLLIFVSLLPTRCSMWTVQRCIHRIF